MKGWLLGREKDRERWDRIFDDYIVLIDEKVIEIACFLLEKFKRIISKIKYNMEREGEEEKYEEKTHYFEVFAKLNLKNKSVYLRFVKKVRHSLRKRQLIKL